MTFAAPSRDHPKPNVSARLAQNSAGLQRAPFLVRKALTHLARIEKGALSIVLPGGERLLVEGHEPGPHADLIIRDYSLARKIALAGEIGAADSYIDGDWETSNLTTFLELFSVNRDQFDQGLQGSVLLRAARNLQFWLRANTRGGARRNIHAHYDLGNEFYKTWLDPTMTYSSGLFADGDQDDLVGAQIRKYRALAESLDLRPGARLLEIGCGWGGFAVYAARTYGCRVVALTISREQFDYARRRAFEAGLNDLVEIRLRDYRDEKDVYDKIASIEMIEAVGEAYWPLWFRLLREGLAAGGRAAMQAITVDESIFPLYRRRVDFIRHAIFPGGMLPTAQILRALGEKSGLCFEGRLDFGFDYARTLEHWRRRFRSGWPRLTELGFDERFRRLWEFYFAYCEAGFRSGVIDVTQMSFSAPG